MRTPIRNGSVYFRLRSVWAVDRSGPIDAKVTSVNLTTGEAHTWIDREITYSDSSVGHVFEAAFRAQYEERYRLIVRRSDGAESSAEVTIPPHVKVELTD